MQADFQYLWKQLVGEIPSLPPDAAQRYVSNAWLKVQKEREWSWRHKEGIVLFPAQITTGTISLTKYSSTGTLSAAALAAWNADTNLPLLGSRQLRFPGTPDRIYSITAFDSGTGVVTLDSIYTTTTAATSTYSLYSAYVYPMDRLGVAESFFGRFISLRNLTTGDMLYGSKANTTPLELNRLDRGRSYYGYPYLFAHAKTQDIGTYPTLQRLRWYEFWPHCTTATAWETLYITEAKSFEEDPTQILPASINPELVLMAAREKVYDWADMNRGSIKGLSGTNWGLKKAQLMNRFATDASTYPNALRDHAKADDDIINQTIIPQHGLNSTAYHIPTTTLVQVSA